METVTVNVTRVDPALDLEADLRRARVLAKLMDGQFEVAGVKFGLDAIIGLVPAVGDTITAAIALYPLYLARKHDLGKVVLTRMAINVGADWLTGLVPVIGDVADVAFKANLKNLALLEKAAEARRRGGDVAPE